MKTLHLKLFKKWFDAILSGEKREEYRAQTPFWVKRLAFKNYDAICFRNGYAANAPQMTVECLGLRLGEFQGVKVFALQLGRILEVKNVKPQTSDDFFGSIVRPDRSHGG